MGKAFLAGQSGKTNKGDALQAHVLLDKTFSSKTLHNVAGTMPNIGAISGNVGVGGAYEASPGGYVTDINIAGPVLDGDSDVTNVLSGKTFYKDSGVKQTGAMPDRTGDTEALSISRDGTVIKLKASDGYRDGVNDFVTHADANDIAANIKQGVTIRGLAGNFTGDADALASEILQGKTAYVNGVKLTGTMLAGKKFATGSTGTSAPDDYNRVIDVSGLSFTPSVIVSLTSFDSRSYAPNDDTGTPVYGYRPAIIGGRNMYLITDGSATAGGFRAEPVSAVIPEDAWTPYISGGAFRFRVDQAFYLPSSITISWIAFE